MDCLFCGIIEGKIPCDKVYEDDKVLAFRDISPQSKVHVLIVPKTHISDVLECGADTAEAVTRAIGEVARLEGVDKTGFRCVTNCGDDACQSVKHMHVHLLGGEKLSERMS